MEGGMSPEFQSAGIATQKLDMFALGVVLLELLSGAEALKYEIDDRDSCYKRISVMETARDAMGDGDDGGRLGSWVDRRLKDSYPVEVAARVGLDCVEDDPDKRPEIGQVAVLILKLYLESQSWAESIGIAADFSVSLATR